MFRLFRLKWKLKRRERAYSKAYEEQKKLHGLPIRVTDIDLQSKGLREAERALEGYISFHMISVAADLDIEVPKISDAGMWIEDDGGTRVWLSPQGRTHVRKLIDAEKARRFDVRTLWVTKFWLPLLAALVGIIGALTGLVAVLQHKK